MDDIVDVTSDTSSPSLTLETDSDSEVEYLQPDMSVIHNNNGSLIDQEVLTTQQVFELMERQMNKVMDVTGLSSNKVRSLLNDFKWNSDKLIETYYEGGKKIKKLMENAWTVKCCDVRKSSDCEICFETFLNPNQIKRFPCNNRFCYECLLDYVSSTIKDGGLLGTAIKCPGYNCSYELNDESVFQVLKDPKLKLKYLQIVANCFVQNNRLIKWCPNANCENAVRLEPGAIPYQLDQTSFVESVRCSCGFWFCFLCHSNSHDPVACEMLVRWSKVRTEDIEAQEWILLNTKPCPGCRSNIEKQGGCMHMTCSKCRHQFCWICLGLWTARHNCDQINTVNIPAAESKIVRRFATYNAKHETMNQSYTLDCYHYKHKMVSGTELELEMQWIKIDFVAHAVETLLQCRRTLMHSYIFSYFMTTIDNQMYIFEENLKYLEQRTEQLSEVLENDVTSETIPKMKSRIVDETAFCSKLRRDLIDHVREGYDNNWWRKFPIPHEELIAAELRMGEEAVQRLLY